MPHGERHSLIPSREVALDTVRALTAKKKRDTISLDPSPLGSSPFCIAFFLFFSYSTYPFYSGLSIDILFALYLAFLSYLCYTYP